MKITDIAFWILILAAIALAIWKLFGSPSDIATLISITSLLIGSEILLWKHYFKLDKDVSIGFMKVRHDINNLKEEFSYRFDEINYKLENINQI